MRSFPMASTCMLILAAACGDKRGGSVKPLTDAQKKELKKTLADASAATRASKSANKARRGGDARRTRGLTVADSVFAAPFSFDAQQSEPNYQAMEDSLQNCLVEEKSIMQGLEQTGLTGMNFGHGAPQQGAPDLSKLKGQSFGYKVYGEQCPIKLGMSLSIPELDIVGEELRSLIVNFGFEYAALTDEFKRLGDIDAFKFDGGLQASGSRAINAKMNIDGKFHSQAKGDILMKIAGLMQGTEEKMNQQVTMTMTFPDFVAELLVKGNGQSEPEFFLNGEKMTKEQVQQFFAEALDAGQTVGGSPGNDNGSNNGEEMPPPPVNEPNTNPPNPNTIPQPEFPGFPVRR